MSKKHNTTNLRLRSPFYAMRNLKFAILYLLIAVALSILIIFADTGTNLWWLIVIIVVFALLALWSFKSVLGDKIVVNYTNKTICFKKGLDRWKNFIRKKCLLEFSLITNIKYKKNKEEGRLYLPDIFRRYCEKGEIYYEEHVIEFLLNTGENIECQGMAYSRQKDSNGQWVDITEEKTREVVDKLNDILNEWREKNEIQSLQEGNLSDNIEAVQNREYEDTEPSTE